jgi:hypothetical protein
MSQRKYHTPSAFSSKRNISRELADLWSLGVNDAARTFLSGQAQLIALLGNAPNPAKAATLARLSQFANNLASETVRQMEGRS